MHACCRNSESHFVLAKVNGLLNWSSASGRPSTAASSKQGGSAWVFPTKVNSMASQCDRVVCVRLLKFPWISTTGVSCQSKHHFLPSATLRYFCFHNFKCQMWSFLLQVCQKWGKQLHVSNIFVSVHIKHFSFTYVLIFLWIANTCVHATL